MILYYTGTKNSEYVAKRIAENLNETSENLFDRLKHNDYSEIHSDSAFVIVCPTYGWQIPHILRDWLKKVKFTGSKDIYFVMTCGSDIGNAYSYLIQLCKEIHMNYLGCAEIVMPENYVAMFAVPENDEAVKIIDKAETAIFQTSDYIKNNQIIPSKKTNVIDHLKSGVINDVFYSLCISDKKFTVSDKCVGCGKCVKDCVLNNIQLVDGKPKWNHHCTHCMSCICGCPTYAIEYGKASLGKPRYQCPKK